MRRTGLGLGLRFEVYLRNNNNPTSAKSREILHFFASREYVHALKDASYRTCAEGITSNSNSISQDAPLAV